MKSSRFNNFFPFEDKRIGFNAYSGDFVILDPELLELFNAAKNENDWDGLKEIHESFYDCLCEKGFIILDDVDEIQNVKDLVHKMDHENNEKFELTINPTMNCNFKCWYCYETHIKESKMNEETLQNILCFVDNILDENKDLKEFRLQWFGGEPLLYFHKTVKPLLEGIYPKMLSKGINFGSGFTTNGFLINQDILDACKNNGVDHFQITLDGHRERHNQVRFVSKSRGSYDEIITNIILCLKKEFSVTVRVNVSEETLDNLNIIADDFITLTEHERQFMNFSFHEVWQEEKEIGDEIQSVVNVFREKGFNTLYKGSYLDTVRSSCYADKKNHATLNYNGEAFKCTARDFESTSKEGDLNTEGRIIWNEKYHKRMESKFKNPPCLECSILPICNGGCSQQAIEHQGVEYCVHGFDNNKKLDVIKDRFLYALS